jgi:glycosyltransferase involved in cell wall biosynthesis
MRILQVNAGYHPFIGGAQTYTQAMSKRFAAQGHDVTVVTTNAAEIEYFWNPRKRHVAPGREELNGAHVIRCRVSHLPGCPWSFYILRRLATIVARLPVNVTPLLRRLAPYMPGVPDVESTLAALPGPFDLVHGVNVALEWPMLAAWHYARRHRIPFIATPFVHVGERGQTDVLINYTMPHQLESLQDADAVMVQTDIEAQALIRLGVARERLHKLGMGVDLDELQGGDAGRFRACYDLDGPLVTFLGVVTYDKGSFHLVRAMERLWEQERRAHLVLAGPPVDEFIRFRDRLSPATRERIIMPGTILGQDKRDMLAATDVFVLPSRIDSFGIVYLEAWAYGKPVVGARAGGVPDVIDEGVDGLLVEFGNVAQIAAAIDSLLADPDRAREMGQRGRAKVETHHTWDRIYDRLWTVCEQLHRSAD